MPDPRPSPHPRNHLNELTGEEWLYFTKSLWTTAYPSELGHALRRRHGANKPPRLMARLIEFFSMGGETVLDPFAGSGTVGQVAEEFGRDAVLIELNPVYVQMQKGRDALKGVVNPQKEEESEEQPGWLF